MKFDFGYVEQVYRIIEGHDAVESLCQLEAHRLLMEHSRMSGMDYATLQALQSIREGEANALARSLLANKVRVLEIVDYVWRHGEEITLLLQKHVRNVFPGGKFAGIIIYFALGYDAIGYKGNVVCSLDLGLILADTRELISLLVHELAHVVHCQYCPAIGEISLAPETLADTINLLIQLEGVGIFSAFHYRQETGILANTDGPIRRDYIITPELEVSLWEAYRKIQRLFAEERGTGEILDVLFSSRLDHALGYVIFQEIFKVGGMAKVREAAAMSPVNFTRRYLQPKV